MKRTYMLVMLSVMVWGCANLDTQYFSREKPDEADLVGVYRATPETLAWVREDGGYQVDEITITLGADGKAVIDNLPDWHRTGFGDPTAEHVLDHIEESWEIRKSQSWWYLHIPGTWINIVGQEPPYDLWIYVGDPDSGDVMIFERVDDASDSQ